MSVEASEATRRTLTTGSPIGWWEVGATLETRYDGPAEPLSGAMDPLFFVTRHKNFVPHEYPCRTHFAASRRGVRPLASGAFEPQRIHFPYGSPRLDLSGFWFRPTVLGTWARTRLLAAAAGPARFRLRTCGGAVLFVDGREVGWLAPYSRNLEAEAVFDVDLAGGVTEIQVWFDDLAERDARYFIQLDYLDGPPAAILVGGSAEASVTDAVEAALGSIHFDRPSYDGGTPVLVIDEPLPIDADVEIAVSGDFISADRSARRLRLRAGETRLIVGSADDLPADFRHFTVTLAVEGIRASRGLGVEIAHAARQGPAPAALADRIAEALAHVAATCGAR